MRYRVPKALNTPLLFFGLPSDDLAIVVVFVSILIIVFKNAGFRSILGIIMPVMIGFFIAFVLKKIAEVRPVGYIRHIMHKYGVWNDKMRANHLMAPGKRLYSP